MTLRARPWPIRFLRASLRHTLPARLVAAYFEYQGGTPAREAAWVYLQGLPELPLLTHTRHGWMSYGSHDAVIGRALFLEGQFEYGLLTRAVTLLRALGYPLGGLLVDVGANIGTVTCALLRDGIVAQAAAIEPIPATYRRLRRNVWLNGLRRRVWLVPGAVGVMAGPVAMTLSPTNPGDHRVRPVVSLGPDQMAESARPTVTVPGYRLDDVVPERPALLWMDVQGYELRVLDGAPRLLATGVPVVMEFSPYLIGQAGIPVAEFCDGLAARFGSFLDLNASVPTRLPITAVATLFAQYQGLAFTDLLVLPP